MHESELVRKGHACMRVLCATNHIFVISFPTIIRMHPRRLFSNIAPMSHEAATKGLASLALVLIGAAAHQVYSRQIELTGKVHDLDQTTAVELESRKGEIKSVKGEMESVKVEIKNVKGEVESVKGEIRNVSLRLEQVFAIVQRMEAQKRGIFW